MSSKNSTVNDDVELIIWTHDQHPCVVCGFITTRTNRLHSKPSCSYGCDTIILETENN
jgi:hypothetical protein